MHQDNTTKNVKIIKLVNGDELVAVFPKEQLPEKSPLLRLEKPLQVKYVPQFTPQGFRDYVALIKWTSYSQDIIITIPKDKIMTITTASADMIRSYDNVVINWNNENKMIKSQSSPQGKRIYEKKRFSDQENNKLNEIFDELDDDEDITIH